MKTNVGSADRVVRVALGIAIGAAGIYFESWFGLIGLVLVATGLAGRCPAYLPFGISTCAVRTEGS